MAARQTTTGLGRREFLAGAAVSTFTLIKPSLVRGTEANSTIELGVIGCGGRGKWISDLFMKHGKYRLVACADYFKDRVDAFGDRFKVPAERRFTTLSGYKKLLETKADAIVIETPPYFHPEQAAAAVEAGRHVFLAKPIAVDVPGCQTVLESGRKATAKKLTFRVDFQTRANEFYREAAKRVHAGEIGKLVHAEARYPYAGALIANQGKTAEDQLRLWYPHTVLSGDFIVEQSIHSLDVATWFLNADPVKAFGTAGRGVRFAGDILDHYAVTYWFPNDVVLSFSCIQAIRDIPNEIYCRVYGAKGLVDSDYYRSVWIRGEKPYPGGEFKDLFTDGAVTNIAEFYDDVVAQRCGNETVPASVRSNLTAVFGRTAGRANGMVTWDEMMKKAEKLELDTKGLKA